MKIKVSATRMQLMYLKKRYKLAVKGHKLLKDKQDQLVREFFLIIYEYKKLRESVEQKLGNAYNSMMIARSVMGDIEIDNAFYIPTKNVVVNEKFKNVMSVKIPVFNAEIISSKGESYSKILTSVELDNAVKSFSELVEKLIKLAEIEYAVKALAREIEVTRRRVNALEYVLMPDLQEAIRFITMKINEMERSNLTRIMKIKDIVRSKS